MTRDDTCIVTVNAGSSSIKLDVLIADSHQKIVTINADNIGQETVTISIRRPDQPVIERQLGALDRVAATKELLAVYHEFVQGEVIVAVGHRIVHGGIRNKSVLIDDHLVQELSQFASFDPEHMPAALDLIATCREFFAGVPHIACFDTAFFGDLPTIAQLLPLPSKYANLGLKRYGFHGLSYSFLTERLKVVAGQTATNKVILAHLGSGASLAAVKDGRPVDTTMSFTPASGVVMSTRSGDLDPGIAMFLQEKAGMSVAEFTHMVNHESGLLGVSGLSSEMKTLIDAAPSNHLAALAVELFCYRVRLAIGSLSAAMGGVDTIVFSGGIGEKSAIIRAKICNELGYLGVKLDDGRNGGNEMIISDSEAPVQLYVIPTDEAQTIAREVQLIIDHKQTLEG